MFFSIFLLALTATADSFILGFNYGLKKVHITISANLFISCICFLGTAFSMCFGKMLGILLPPRFTDIFGGLLLVLMGIFMLRATMKSQRLGYCYQVSTDPSSVDKDKSDSIEAREALALGGMLCLNNMGLGIGASMTGMSIFVTPLLCAFFSFLLLQLGVFCGKRLQANRFSALLETLCAVLILLLGTYEIFF